MFVYICFLLWFPFSLFAHDETKSDQVTPENLESFYGKDLSPNRALPMSHLLEIDLIRFLYKNPNLTYIYRFSDKPFGLLFGGEWSFFQRNTLDVSEQKIAIGAAFFTAPEFTGVGAICFLSHGFLFWKDEENQNGTAHQVQNLGFAFGYRYTRRRLTVFSGLESQINLKFSPKFDISGESSITETQKTRNDFLNTFRRLLFIKLSIGTTFN
jgi:hypothetical protein